MLVTHHQEKNWPAYEAALGNLAKLRVEQYQEQNSANSVELLRQRAEDLSSASAALKQLADAGEPLLNSPDDAEAPVFHVRQQRPLIACQAYEKHNGKNYDRRQGERGDRQQRERGLRQSDAEVCFALMRMTLVTGM
jgi:hypothetical protein